MKFRHKNGGICEVFTADAIDRLKNNSEYTELCGKKAANSKPPIDKEEEQNAENS